MKIVIKTIPHGKQRYPTIGDWLVNGDTITIKVSEMGNWKFEMLVAVHELIEAILCKSNGIRQEDVDEFDMQYEVEREKGLHRFVDEPGADRKAPYRNEHAFATKIEKMLLRKLNVDWDEYDKTALDL